MVLALKSGPQIAAKTGNPAGLLLRRIWYSVGKSGVLGITEYRQGRPLEMVLGFLAEKNLTFPDAPDLIQPAKTLTTDSEALAELRIDRMAASYKMQFGVGKTIADELAINLRKNFFSLNEATSKSSSFLVKKLLSYLVSYFSAEDEKVDIGL